MSGVRADFEPFEIQNQDFQSLYLHFCCARLVRSGTRISNPRPAEFCYAARYVVCRLCIYLYHKNYTTLWAVIYTPLIVIFTCGAREPAHSNGHGPCAEESSEAPVL